MHGDNQTTLFGRTNHSLQLDKKKSSETYYDKDRMGGRSSQPLPSAEPSVEEADEGEQEGFLTLSESLQEQMALEFQNEQVVKMFGKQMEKIGEQQASNYKEAVEQKAVLERKMKEFRQQNKAVQDKLNAAIEGFEDKFTDGSNVLEYDISRLEKQYLGSSSSGKTNSRIPCFVEQIEIATCLRTKNNTEESKNDPFACDAFIKALAECTDKTITSK